MSSNDIHYFFHYADYSRWNQMEFVSLGEFIYLAHGFNPFVKIHDQVISTEKEHDYYECFMDFDIDKLDDFKCQFKIIKRLGFDLPKESTKETVVQRSGDILVYEAAYLIKWAKLKNLSVNKNYNPRLTSQRKKALFLNKLIGMDIISFNDAVSFLCVFNDHIDGAEEHFKRLLLDAIEMKKITPIQKHHNNTTAEEHNIKFILPNLIKLAKGKGFFVPAELLETDNPKEELSDLRRLFGDNEIVKDGLVDVRKIESTKLVLAIENYVTKMFNVEANKIPSSSSIQLDLTEKYGRDGVTETIARTINECSRHDAKAKVSLNNARKKTIFFQ